MRDLPRRGAGLDEVLLGQRVHPRRLQRADRRAVDERAGRDAHRGGLRDGRRAGKPRAVVHGEASRGDDGRAARGRGRAEPRGGRAARCRRSGARTPSCSAPGCAKKPGARDFALEMFERIDVPLVIDADGLNALEGCFPEDLPQRRWPTVLTPHAGELGRLLERRLRRGRPRAARARPRGRRQGARVRGAQGRRHAGRLAERDGGDLARAGARARHRRHRRRALRA